MDNPSYKQINLPIINLLEEYKASLAKNNKSQNSVIHVDEIASKVARFYEKIRKVVDWKEENLLRRNAITRILKRGLVSEISKVSFIFHTNVDEIAEPLVLELIRGGHLPNDEISIDRISDVLLILKKYVYIIKNSSLGKDDSSFLLKKKVNFFNWIVEIAACEIEEALMPPIKENSLINSMTILMNERIKLNPAELIPKEDKLIQTYVAVHRTLFDLDDAIISYHLIEKQYPQFRHTSDEFLPIITKNIFEIQNTINNQLNHYLAKDFFNLCENTDTAFTILEDLLEDHKNNPEILSAIISDKNQLTKLISKYYDQRLTTLKSRLFKLAVVSSCSVFLSNWFTFFVVEVPVAHLLYEGFSLPAALFDFLIPSIAMFVLVSIIRPPSKSNILEVNKLIYQFVYANEEKSIYEIKEKKPKKPLTNLTIIVLYLLASFLSLGVVAFLFRKAGIPITSVILDTIQIAVNIFAALVIRNKAKEITVEDKASFGEFILDILSLPIAELGSWLAKKWKEYNVISVFFDVVIDVPFVAVIEFLENWRQFLKEKKANIH